MQRKKLGVNIDHVATLRQARKAEYPDPVTAAALAEMAGADSITIHLREDRRHIQDRDVYMLKNTLKTPMNLEMALAPEIIDLALKVLPEEVCIVPERREEVTTEGGLDAAGSVKAVADALHRLKEKNIRASLFIDADKKQIDAAVESGAPVIEIHTGRYAHAIGEERLKELQKIREMTAYAVKRGLQVNAGHGLHYTNVYDIACIEGLDTLNIGHSIISRAVMVGLDRAVRDMIDILKEAAVS